MTTSLYNNSDFVSLVDVVQVVPEAEAMDRWPTPPDHATILPGATMFVLPDGSVGELRQGAIPAPTGLVSTMLPAGNEGWLEVTSPDEHGVIVGEWQGVGMRAALRRLRKHARGTLYLNPGLFGYFGFRRDAARFLFIASQRFKTSLTMSVFTKGHRSKLQHLDDIRLVREAAIRLGGDCPNLTIPDDAYWVDMEIAQNGDNLSLRASETPTVGGLYVFRLYGNGRTGPTRACTQPLWQDAFRGEAHALVLLSPGDLVHLGEENYATFDGSMLAAA